jgi:aminoglycoside 6'-N-acetyltransferase
MADWLSRPHISRWWNHEFTSDAVERDFGPSADGAEPSEDYICLLNDEPVGLLQFCYYSDYPAYLDELSTIVPVPSGAVSIDYFIGDQTLTGRGLGTAMISAFTTCIWASEPAARCVLVPVVLSNPASWRALQRAGFREVARGALVPDNPIDPPAHVVLRLDRPAGPDVQ